MEDIRKKLNPSQFAAVSTIDGPVLVIAGAGSGKTRAIEYRVLNLIQHGIPPEAILLLTFTRKAAHEMISRASRHDIRCKSVDGGTFHSFAFRTLKRYAKVLGFTSQFSILDEGDAAEAIHKCGARLGLFEKERKFPKKDTLKTIISVSINKASPIAHIIDKEYPHFVEFVNEIEALRKEYVAYKVQKGYLDYDDLLVYLKMLLEVKEVREKLSAQYRYIMVDEFQDTNSLQGDIAEFLAERHRNIMIVGDDAQSIYGFRGATHKNIMEFPKRFPDCKIIKLEENYRSTQAILDVANTVLENMHNRYSKCLVSIRKEEGEKPVLNFFKDVYSEAFWIVEKIKELTSEGIEIADQAVLFRSAYVSIPLQAELSKNNIPYQVFGGMKFYETAHVKDVIAHVKVLLNPKDEIAWNRSLMLLDGIGAKTADKLSDTIVQKPSLDDAIDAVLSPKDVKVKYARQLKRFGDFLRTAKKVAARPGLLYELAYEYYLPLMKLKFDDWHIRVNDLETLRQISSRYEDLEQFLADFAIEPPERSVLRAEAEDKSAQRPLTLSTIHSAKGLEWDSVYLIGVVDGVLPSSFSLGDEEEIEEESRLLYVALTRAKNRLFLSLAHEGMRGGITQFNKISRFVDEPNVLGCLDAKGLTPDEVDTEIVLDDDASIKPIYDKDTLMRNILDHYL